MEKVFIFSNTFVAKNILYKIKYLLNIDIKQIILLSENHSEKEFARGDQINVILYNNLGDCISHADITIMIIDKNIPITSIDYIITESQRTGKRYIKIQNPWSEESTDDMNQCKEYDFNKIPTVLCVGLGIESQLYCMELLINKILTTSKVKFNQLYSKCTENLLLQFDDELLNKSLTQQLRPSDKECDVIVRSINIGRNINNLMKYAETIKLTNADFLILQVSADFNDNESAKNIIKFGCFSTLDIITKSRYLSIGRLNVYCNKIDDNNSLTMNIDDCDIEEKLKFLLFSKISYPDGMVLY